MPNQYTGPRPICERFEEKILKIPGGCWEWLACKNNKGYGLFSINSRPVAAHRVSYRLYSGLLKPTEDLLHTCDNPACVNPAHLIIGTHQDNMTDMVLKGRVKKKLTEVQVRQILTDSRDLKTIAVEFGVTFQNISKIKLRKSWRHLQ